MCKDVSIMVENSLKINIIPEWHDGTLLNEWVKNNLDLVAQPRKLISLGFNDKMPFAIIETIEKDRRTDKRYYN